MGDTILAKKVACPQCKTHIEVKGLEGQTIKIQCPKCKTEGVFTFPAKRTLQSQSTGPYIIKVDNLEYSYPRSKNQAINGVSFKIKKGEIFGFLGPNGAGKSTTQKIIIGLLRGYSGNVEILGKNLSYWKTELYNKIGVGFELPNHYQKLTALENLELFSTFYKVKTTSPLELLEMVELEKDANHRVATFSKGMRSKLNFARSLLNNPEVLFLDEPTTGLDPVSSRLIKDIILKKKKEGTTIFLTTHNMRDADELCDRVGFIVDGKLSLIESPKQLKLSHGKKIVKVEYLSDDQLLSEEFDLKNLASNSDFLQLLKSGSIKTMHTAEATLDEIFIKVTGRKLK